jgi:hypothetical protein
MTTRREIADIVVRRMTDKNGRMTERYAASRDGIGHFHIYAPRPEEIVLAIHRPFSRPETTKLNKTLREYKYIASHEADHLYNRYL